MGIGRLFGDRLNEGLGPVRLARGGGALAAAGIVTALVTDAPAVALAGFACAGFGLAGLFPVALRAAAARGAAEAPSVAAVTAFGYLGFLPAPRRSEGWPSCSGCTVRPGCSSAWWRRGSGPACGRRPAEPVRSR